MDNSLEENEVDAILKTFQKFTKDSEKLFVFSIQILQTFLNHCLKITQKKNFFLESNDFSDKNEAMNFLVQTEVLKKMTEHPGYLLLLKNNNYQYDIEIFLKKITTIFLRSEELQAFSAIDEKTEEDCKSVLQFIVQKYFIDNKYFASILESDFITAYEDGYEIFFYLKNSIVNPKAYLKQNTFLDKENIEYSKNFILNFTQKNSFFLKKIADNIPQWEWNRVAKVDKILLIMGVIEMVYMTQTPIPVIINEYIDIANDYSSYKSGKFINGILDTIKTKFVEEGIIVLR